MWLVFIIITAFTLLFFSCCYLLIDYIYHKINNQKKLDNYQVDKEIELAEKTLKNE